MNEQPKDLNSSLESKNFIKRLVGIVVLLNLLVISLMASSLYENRVLNEERAAITTQNLSQVLEQNIGNSISKLDVILLATVDEIEKQLDAGGIQTNKLNSFLARNCSRLPELDGLRVANERGEIAYGVVSDFINHTSVADREYFNRHRTDARAGLVISRPIVSRVTGKWSLIISRRVNNPDGTFAGVVYGVISLEHFHRLFASIKIGAHGSITLRDADLGVVARYPIPKERGSAIGQKIISGRFRDLIAAGQKSGTYNAVYPVDKIERTYTYRRIFSYPLYINVGLAPIDYLAEWREEVGRMLLIVALFFVTTLISSRLIYRGWNRKKIAIQELARQEVKFRTIADFTYDWEFWLGPDGSFIHTSPSCKRITGHDAEAFYSDPDLLCRIVHPDDQEIWSEHRHEANVCLVADNLVFRILHTNGTIRWIEHVCQPIVDETGRFLGTRGSNRDITERKSAEQELRQQFLFLQQLLDAIPIPVFYKDTDGLYLGCNEAFETFIGVQKNRIVGKSVHDVAPGDLADLYHKSDATMYSQPGVQVYEGSVMHGDGTRHDVIFNKATFVDADGCVAGIVGAITDVTQRKKDEDALCRINRTLRTLTKCNETLVRAEDESDLLHALCRVITEDGGYRFAWVGYAENDAEKTIRPISHSGFEDGYLEAMDITWDDCERGCGPAGTAIRTGLPCLTKDIYNDPRFALWRDLAFDRGYRSSLAIPLISDEKTLGSLNIYASEPDAFDKEEMELMVQLANDLAYGITALRTREKQKQTAVALWNSMEQYRQLAAERGKEQSLLRALIDSIPDLIFFKDPSGIYLGCNKAFAGFAGHTEENIKGRTDFDLFPREVGEFFQEMDRQMISLCVTRRNEEWVDYPDGRQVLLETLKTPFHDQSGNHLGLIGISRDITERKWAEDERKKLETQLQQAQKMEAIGQLAGGIAHDFNNILTAIIGYSEIILLRMEKTSPLRHHIEKIYISAERAADLTRDLLAFSRKQVLQTKPIDLCETLRGLKEMLGRLIPEDIEFRTTYVERKLIVMADKGQIEQVLMNLVNNAKDAMSRGGILSVDVSCIFMDTRFVHSHGFGEPGDYACLSVSDTGHGMNEETKKNIFEPFFTTKEVGKGTGLGMAIIYGIIKQHKGYIIVYSEPDRGTTFRIYLPLIGGDIEEECETHQAVLAAGGMETILLAEDDETVRELHKLILETAGYSVIEAVNGQDAFEKFIVHQAEVDILVTDVIMPKLDGKRLFEEISKIRPKIKALFMSGYTKDIFAEKGILEDEFNFMAKPVSPSELLNMVRSIIDHKVF
ncbi:PAS domain S-box protein [bacterium]|nr:PAS domain S-box protein [bacterium]